MDEKKTNGHNVNARYVIPFFVVLAILTVVSFIIPLRPTRSQSEKRNLAEFPEFSMEALTSGTYFEEIDTWFSDTFPGRENWLSMSSWIQEFHGYSDIAIGGEVPVDDVPVTVPEAPTAPVTLPVLETDPVEETQEQVIIEEIAPPSEDVEEWGGVDAGEDAEIMYGNSLIQIGDTIFSYCKFSQMGSDRYIQSTNYAAASLADKDVRLVSMPIPTSIGIMVENEYLEKLSCTPQNDIINYMFSGMHESVIKVDLYPTLVEHNDEYLYFRTDHHWTARGAYYAYVEICEALGYEPAPLDSFEEWDMGDFEGSNYWSAVYPSKLKIDRLYAYVPQGDIRMLICPDGRSGYEWPLLMDKSHRELNSKYMAFLSGDHALCIVTNNDLPDAPNCVIVKDSYSNAMIPFLTQNYHNVYVIDYRKYYTMRLKDFVVQYDIDDVILANNLNAAQVGATCDLIDQLVK